VITAPQAKALKGFCTTCLAEQKTHGTCLYFLSRKGLVAPDPFHGNLEITETGKAALLEWVGKKEPASLDYWQGRIG